MLLLGAMALNVDGTVDRAGPSDLKSKAVQARSHNQAAQLAVEFPLNDCSYRVFSVLFASGILRYQREKVMVFQSALLDVGCF